MSIVLDKGFFTKINKEIIDKKIMGGCDNCSKLLYVGDEIYQNIDLKHTHFNLEFCNQTCYNNKGIKYPFIKNYNYETIIIKKKDISNSLSSLLSFLVKYPWTILWSIYYGSISILEYIIKVQQKEILNKNEKLFLDDCRKHNLI